MDKKQWMGRSIAHSSHIHDLERAAALKEFGNGMDREDAEKQAYHEYLRDQHVHAAAHHLRGLQAAQGSGDLEEARLHGEAYHHHMSRAGFDSMDRVPEEVRGIMEHEGKGRHYKFKAHPADVLLAD